MVDPPKSCEGDKLLLAKIFATLPLLLETSLLHPPPLW